MAVVYWRVIESEIAGKKTSVYFTPSEYAIGLWENRRTFEEVLIGNDWRPSKLHACRISTKISVTEFIVILPAEIHQLSMKLSGIDFHV